MSQNGLMRCCVHNRCCDASAAKTIHFLLARTLLQIIAMQESVWVWSNFLIMFLSLKLRLLLYGAGDKNSSRPFSGIHGKRVDLFPGVFGRVVGSIHATVVFDIWQSHPTTSNIPTWVPTQKR